jgi:predicted dehydrogenase
MTIRIGVIGAGGNTRDKHIPGLRALPGVAVVAVANSSAESSDRAARALGIARAYPDWRELVADGGIDAVVIGTWPDLHAAATIAALEAGKHVLCEARMAMDLAQARAMRACARARPRRVAQIVPAPFALRVEREVERLLADGVLGRLLAVRMRDAGRWLDRAAPLSWRQDAARSGRNIMSLGIWWEILMRWTGDARRVFAAGKVFQETRRDAAGSPRAVQVPEHLDVIADLVCGAQAHLQVSAVSGLAGPSEVWLHGERATLRFSEDRLWLGAVGDASMHEHVVPAEHAGRWRVEEEFVAAIRGEGVVERTTLDDGVRYMAFTDAVAASLASGRAEAVPEIWS